HLHRPEGLVPPGAHDPFAGSGLLNFIRDAGAKLIERFHSGEINTELCLAGIIEVQMRVVETGHGEMSAEIDDLCLRAFEFFQVESFADGKDAVSLHRNGFLPLDGSELSIGGHARVDVGVNKNDIGLGPGVGCGSAGLPHTRGRENANEHNASQTRLACQTHSPTPASASMVSRMRFSPSSRPLESNHSCSV